MSDLDQAVSRQSNFGQLPIEIRVSVGGLRMPLNALLDLSQDDVLGLDRGIDDPVELYVGQRMVARGELVELEGETKGRLGLRVTEIAEHGDAS